jgi:hypothetical protein
MVKKQQASETRQLFVGHGRKINANQMLKEYYD